MKNETPISPVKALGKIVSAEVFCRDGIFGFQAEVVVGTIRTMSSQSTKTKVASRYLDERMSEIFGKLRNIMESAQVETVADLKGTPIEATLVHDPELKRAVVADWRVLTEVL